MEIVAIQNDWYSMTNDERIFVKAVETSKDGRLTGASDTPETLGFIQSDGAGAWSVTDKFRRLYE